MESAGDGVVGRDAELAAVDEALRAAVPTVVVITGAAGIGLSGNVTGTVRP